MYKVLVEKKVKKILKKLPKSDYTKVKKSILSLGQEPRPAGYIKLKDREGYRIRQGNYRIVYDIEDDIKVVAIINVGHRKVIYKQKP
ncbi:MAG: type II toxin-antitoxin system RelE/ParE family toxin [Bacteroidales bacterium]|nr:type II toxin-antitoxin system RelE/ParE family toxin [Bacteroidales bacterium]